MIEDDITKWTIATATFLSLIAMQNVHASVSPTYGCYLLRPSAEDRAEAWKYGFVTSGAEVCFGANGFTRETISSIDPTWNRRSWMTYDQTHMVIGHDTCVVKVERNGNLSFSVCQNAGL